MTLPTRLVEIREKNGYTRKRLAEELNRPYRTITNYETGEREPGHEYIIEIAKKFGVTTDYILGLSDSIKPATIKAPSISDEAMKLAKDYDGLDHWGQKQVRSTADIEAARVADEHHRAALEEDTKPRSNVISLPVNLAAAAEGFGAWLDNDCDPISVQLNSITGKADMVIKVQGHSMEPSYQDGDYVLVRFQPDIEVGEVGIWTIDGLGYVKERGEDRLISQNSDIPDIIIGEQECICVGKVISKLPLEWIENI